MIISFTENVVFVLVSTHAKRIENAKQFLKENFIEIIDCAARIYDLIEITLYNLIKDQKDEQSTRREKHNKILSQNESAVIHDLIRSFFYVTFHQRTIWFTLLFHDWNMQKKSNVSSRRWFQTWWKNNELHEIKIKSLTIIWYFAA
jgi:hypothetical protein